MFSQKHQSFFGDVLEKSRQGFAASAAFLTLGGLAAGMVVSWRGEVPPAVEASTTCDPGYACVLERQPGFRQVDDRWYAASEDCSGDMIPVVPLDEPRHCDSRLRGGAVPRLLGECWKCEER